MYRIIQPNIRGGICHASVRHARANNKLMGSLFDPLFSISYIMEVDANNLYGWAMSQEMPDGDFEWVSGDDCRNMEQLLNYADGPSPFSIMDYSIIERMRRTRSVLFSM